MHIPGYTIEREIGHGGMATVYLAVQESLHRQVALKVMSAALAADRKYSERFFKEAHTHAQLSHPHIIAIHDVGIAEHNHYLALEYISGGDLKAMLRHRATSPDIAFRIVREIASALGYAHSRVIDNKKGIVHRDIKPENILFREGGMAVLTDFGIARFSGGGTLTEAGMSIGTPHYMSPEQARGKAVDGRADIYALGIVLYEMLTGKVPYDAEETMAICIKHLTEPMPELPPALAGYQSILDRMLAKEPDDRYRTAEDLIQAIDSHDPNSKPRPSAPRHTVVMPSMAQSAEASTAGSRSGIKWALVGGIAAVAGLATVWAIQNGGNGTSVGGGSGSVVINEPAKKSRTALEEVVIPTGPQVPSVQPPEAKVAVAPPQPPVPAPSAVLPSPPPKPKTAVPAPPKADPVKVELAAWTAAQGAGSLDSYRKYLSAYPAGTFAVLAKTRIAKLEGSAGSSGGNEASAWQAAEQANSCNGYSRFLADHPTSAFAALAKARIMKSCA